MPCENELVVSLTDLFGFTLAANPYLDTGDIYDLVHSVLVQTFGDDVVSPALTAYALTHAAMTVHPGSIVESGLGNRAVLWSLGAQGLRSKQKSKGDLVHTAIIDFTQPKHGNRATCFFADGSILPGVRGPDMTDYPGFRPATDEEMADENLAIRYYTARREDEKVYQLRRKLDVTLENLGVLQSILATNASSDPGVTDKVDLLNEAATIAIEQLTEFSVNVADEDGDGIINGEDDCSGDNTLIGQSCDSPVDVDDCASGTWSCSTGTLICLDNDADDDADADGVYDCEDDCPLDGEKSAPGECGCGVPEVDTDADGVLDCMDNCPAIANPEQADEDSNGIGDACAGGGNSSDPTDSGCGCATRGEQPPPLWLLFGLGLLAVLRRSRRQ